MKQWEETKEQRKERKALEKEGLISVPSEPSRYVFCLKWGTKYGPEYVNKLYSMVQRNLTLEHKFVCFTDNPKGINPEITTHELPPIPATGWWFKPWFLSNELPYKGTGLFLDLDLIVFNNIDRLFTYQPEKKFVIIRDFNRSLKKNYDRMNSSVFRFEIGQYHNVYTLFKANIHQVLRRFQGDQDFMYTNIKDHAFWPDDWIQSYKWEMRNRNELGIVNGKRNFRTAGEPNILPNTCIAVFHGEPNIPDCVDKWPRDNWG
jgi:hypothetical protein